jgi:hypothetical protein
VKTEELYQQRLTRILEAVALQKPDRTPVILQYSGFAAHITNTTMADYLSSPAKNLETMIQAYHLVGDGDAINYGTFWPYGLSYVFMAKVRVPGVDLPKNEMWQVVETELMIPADYDQILEKSWPAFSEEFMKKRVFDDAPPEFFPPLRKPVKSREKWRTNGVPVLSGGDITTPIEVLCGARSLMEFAVDLIQIPDRVQLDYPAVWIGGWRSAPCLLSPAMWDRFVWPYFRQLVDEVVDAGLIAVLHLDSDWTRELKRFRELPKAKCILALDGETDIYKAKKILGDHLCIMGDVPASMLYLESPDNVYEYSCKLVRELGPEGFILHSGCDIPANAKLENVQAMVAAVID